VMFTKSKRGTIFASLLSHISNKNSSVGSCVDEPDYPGWSILHKNPILYQN
jgi:hypothetical protein